jgi:acylphosphatase
VDRGERVSHDVGIAFEVYGRVQGVGYRAFTAREAAALSLRGWVKNRPDGAVEGVAVGRRADLGVFLGRLRVGPTWAEVIEVRHRPNETGSLVDFVVRW